MGGGALNEDNNFESRIASAIYDCTTKSPWKDDIFKQVTDYKKIQDLSKEITLRVIPSIHGIYISNRIVRVERNRQIYDKFNGKNHNELAKEYKLTHRMICNIISGERKSRKSNRL